MMQRSVGLFVVGAVALAACGDDAGGDAGEAPESLTLVAYESFPTDPEGPIAAAFAEFTDDTGIDVEVLIAGDTGTMLSKAELTAGNPEGDVMYGIDNTFLSRAVDAEVFAGEPVEVDFGDVCVNYDIAALEAAGVPPPETLDDLADPAYRDMLVVESAASSSPGLAFLLATIAEHPDGWESLWQRYADNGVLVVDSWTQAYYEEFSFSGGDRPLVVSYGSSPPYEAIYAEAPIDAVSTGVAEGTCFRQTEYAGVLDGTAYPEAAEQLLDFLTSERFQREIALNLFMFPIDDSVELDPAFTEFATIPDEPLTLDPDEIDAHRSEWIDRWSAIATA